MVYFIVSIFQGDSQNSWASAMTSPDAPTKHHEPSSLLRPRTAALSFKSSSPWPSSLPTRRGRIRGRERPPSPSQVYDQRHALTGELRVRLLWYPRERQRAGVRRRGGGAGCTREKLPATPAPPPPHRIYELVPVRPPPVPSPRTSMGGGPSSSPPNFRNSAQAFAFPRGFPLPLVPREGTGAHCHSLKCKQEADDYALAMGGARRSARQKRSARDRKGARETIGL